VAGKAATTSSSGRAIWSSFAFQNPPGKWDYGARLRAEASVNKTFGRLFGTWAVGGEAYSEAADPMEFDFVTTGSIQYEVMLGSEPTNEFGIYCDDPTGTNSIVFVANFTNVYSSGFVTRLAGQLFSLVIQSTGVLTNSDNLTITFSPWSGLGMDSGQIQAVQEYVRSNMSLLPDGVVGFMGQIPLVGTNGPIPTISLSYQPGPIFYDDSLLGSASGAQSLDGIQQPPLGIGPSGNGLSIYWPNTFPGFQLRCTPTLGPTSWTPVTNFVTQLEDVFYVDVDPFSAQQFYQLMQ
jgi:hypothetical protein